MDISLFRAVHANGTLGGSVMEAVRIGSVRSCVCKTFWITGLILVIAGTAPGVLFRVCRRCVRGVVLI